MAGIRPIDLIRDPRPGLERLPHLRKGLGQAHHAQGQWRHVAEAVPIEEHLVVARRDGERAAGPISSVVDHEQPGHSLVLKPLASVSLGDARPSGQVSGGRGTALGERPVKAEAFAYPKMQEVEGGNRGAEESLDKLLPRRCGTACCRLGHSQASVHNLRTRSVAEGNDTVKSAGVVFRRFRVIFWCCQALSAGMAVGISLSVLVSGAVVSRGRGEER